MIYMCNFLSKLPQHNLVHSTAMSDQDNIVLLDNLSIRLPFVDLFLHQKCLQGMESGQECFRLDFHSNNRSDKDFEKVQVRY